MDGPELEDLERIRDLLRLRGLAEAEKGLSDYGNSWFAFCDGDGRVLLHIARIGRTYHYDGVGIATPRVVSRLGDIMGRLRSLRIAA